ncbi:hypothetical protein DL96DRAFT_1573776 [Flagelloscypha sp. PMI_526]|nr:hypothetical protein DL96DRAFT_1573776 [Flagelloscypha sp. PMI_526]
MSDPEFVPRREFHRKDSVRHDFALLALSSNNQIRLYSFPLPVISNLRRLLLDRVGITSFREDTVQNFSEFTMEGKPWGSPKAIATESLLLSILSVIYACNYTFLSLLDYGRESDDRLAMAFATPTPASLSGSTLSLVPPKRTPFALSFPSATMLRVINPPLDSTPAILQAVRGAWPRGVISEKKVGDACFEFKLKGYRWFQEDTFATDSLRHILSLLSALDAHTFTLLGSVSLTNRSRVKDLWVFTGPISSQDRPSGTPDTLDSVSNFTKSPVPLSPLTATSSLNKSPQASPRQLGHRKLATEPLITGPGIKKHHERSASDSGEQRRHSTLRKAAPRAQIPVSVAHDDQDDSYRTVLPSMVSENDENMTGIGAGGFPDPPLATPDVFYSTSPLVHPAHIHQLPTPVAPVPGLLAAHESNRNSTASSGQDSQATKRPEPISTELSDTESNGQSSPATVRDILSPGAFRDSALSLESDSDATHEIPIAWTGESRESSQSNTFSELPEENSGPPTAFKPPLTRNSDSSVPMIPGGWQPTPVNESPPEISPEPTPTNDTNDAQTPVQESVARRPELLPGDPVNRHSEVGVVGEMTPPPPVPDLPSESQTPVVPTSGNGWVIVNVDGPPSASPETNSVTSPTPISAESASENSSQASAISSGSKAPTAPSTIKRLFSLSRRDSSRGKTEQTIASAAAKVNAHNAIKQSSQDSSSSSDTSPPTPPDNIPQKETPKKSKSGLRQKLKLLGTPEATRNEDQRREIE